MRAAQPSLFDPPQPDGLSYRTDIVSFDEEAALVAQLAELAVAPFQFHGWEGKRQVRSFGWRYDFNEASFAETAPIPEFLLPLRKRAAAFAGLAADDLAQALVIRYDPGAGIGWHRDRPVFDKVVGVSLLTPCTLRLRRRTETGFERASLSAEPRSIYLLDGEARRIWEHSITAMARLRWSVTFRSLAERALTRRAP